MVNLQKFILLGVNLKLLLRKNKINKNSPTCFVRLDYFFGGDFMKEIYFLLGFVSTIVAVLVTENAMNQVNSKKKNQ